MVSLSWVTSSSPLCNICIVEFGECLRDNLCTKGSTTKVSALSKYVKVHCGRLDIDNEVISDATYVCPTITCPTALVCTTTAPVTCAPCPALKRPRCVASLKECERKLSFWELSKNGAQGRDVELTSLLLEAQANASSAHADLRLCNDRSETRLTYL